AGGRLIAALSGHEGPINAIAFSRDGKQLASAATDGVLKIWNTPSVDQPVAPPVSERLVPLPVILAADGKTLYAGRADGRVETIDPATGTKSFLQGTHDGPVTALALSPDGTTLASGGWDGLVKLWSLKEWRALHSEGGHDGPVRCLAYSADGQRL